MKIKNNLAIVLSLCIAILLWFYVFGQVNPTIKTTIKDIPITLENLSKLDEKGLAILYQDYENVSITYSAQRTSSSSIEASDFKVSCDVGSLEEGSTTLRLDVTYPEDANIEKMTTQSIKISVEEKKNVKKDIEVKIINDNKDLTEPYIVQLSNSSVTISGAKSLIESIDKVIAELDAKKVTNELGAFMSKVKAIDKDGNEIHGINYSVSDISITSRIVSKKTVPLTINVIGVEEERFKRTCDYPSVITIKGDANKLESITSINAKDIDISDVFESKDIDIEPVLPKGIEIAWDSKDIHLTVNVDKVGIKTFKYTEADIKIVGISSNTKATIDSQEVIVTIAGPAKDIEKTTESDIKLSINLEGLESGSHKVAISINSDLVIDQIKTNPSTINVNIR